ncbi:hypothetical protein [Burkholderia cenocepacia]|uniref:hypothetical protein n=1 Tax=Burkholderia cenocepacia TaxID=95486 RepID=UPI001BA2CB65|nr:hypothetical protein [Burkholderia cenocepacia]MBR8427277.1 hypothetical protein [Burkholderia cenocepacia]
MTITLAKFDILPQQGPAGLTLTIRLRAFDWVLPEGVGIKSQIAKLTCADLEHTTIEIESAADGASEVFAVAGESRALVANVEAASQGRAPEDFKAQLARIFDSLREGYQSAVFDAIGKLHDQRVAGGLQYVVGAHAAGTSPQLGGQLRPDAAAARRWMSPGRLTFAAAMLVALAMAGYGIYAKTRPPEDPIASALMSPDAQKRVNAMISGALKQPPEGGGILQGQSVTLDTLKAMGLDPGKANTGCLVGVRP